MMHGYLLITSYISEALAYYSQTLIIRWIYDMKYWVFQVEKLIKCI